MQKPTVAVCIPTYNQADYLARSVESVIRQTYKPSEIWISDDCSTDNTFTVCQELLKKYPFIRYCRQTENLGMSGNPRWIVRQPRTDLIAKLDSDDEYYENYLEELVKLINKYEHAGYVHAATEYIDTNSRRLFISRLARKQEYVDPFKAFRDSFEGFKVTANVILYRRRALEDVDYFRDDLQFCDDWDIAVRMAAAGWGNAYVNKVLSRYRMWDDIEKTRARRHISQVECSTRVFHESIYPNLARFNIDSSIVDEYRDRLAFRHALKDDSHFDSEKKKLLKVAIQNLAANPKIFQPARIMRSLGGNLLVTANHKTKHLLKRIIYASH